MLVIIARIVLGVALSSAVIATIALIIDDIKLDKKYR